MMRMILLALGLAAVAAVAWPLVGSLAGGGGNEATRLVEATERTKNKAEDVGNTYSDIIPPGPPGETRKTQWTPPSPGESGGSPFQHPGAPSPDSPTTRWTVPGPGESGSVPIHVGTPSPGGRASAPQQAGTPSPGGGTGGQSAGGGSTGAGGAMPAATQEPAQPETDLSPAEHAVRDAMDFLARVEAEFGPAHSEYAIAVEQLKRAWEPRYKRAVEEYRRFAGRVNHADEMAYEYINIQDELTRSISDPTLRRTHQERDAQERKLIIEWSARAHAVLGQARAIKVKLDDMNVSITKLELSAAFAAVYEGFAQMPVEITLLNEELARFHQESELIYRTFAPDQGG